METILRYKLHWFLGIIIFLVAGSVQAQQPAEPESGQGLAAPKWAQPLPAKSCPWSASDTNCHLSSPTIADINGDGRKDIVAATNNGHIVAVNHQGSVLWNTDVAGAFGVAAGSQEIASSPAVGDVDGDGRMEVVVGVGTTRTSTCTQGGVIMLNHHGQTEAGWPQLADDWEIAPTGCRDSVFSSPALGDLDNDGDLEVVAGGFDKRIYAWHHDGTLLPGFSPSSYHQGQFADWTDLRGRLGDTIWSSPALADLDGDGFLDIIIGTDEGNVGGNWSCPYQLPPGWYPGYCGGSIYALDRFGQLLPGFPRYIHEAIQSSPAIADINGDGSPEIIVGTGSYYYRHSPDHPQNGFRLFVFDNQGRDFPGWEGGKRVGGPVPASPAVGDISGDEGLEIVIPVSEERKLYAWHANGTPVSGFPMLPVDHHNQTLANFDVGSTSILADYDGDQKMEILFNQAWTVAVVDGTGTQLTANTFPNNVKPIFYAEGTLLNNPAVADLDQDGELELVAHNSTLYVWDLPGSRSSGDAWPSFKRDALGRSYVPMPPSLKLMQSEVIILGTPSEGGGGGTTTRAGSLTISNGGDGEIQWSATTPAGVELSKDSGVVQNQEAIQVSVDATGYEEGFHYLGDITITASSGGQPVAGSPLKVPVNLNIADFTYVFLPALSK